MSSDNSYFLPGPNAGNTFKSAYGSASYGPKGMSKSDPTGAYGQILFQSGGPSGPGLGPMAFAANEALRDFYPQGPSNPSLDDIVGNARNIYTLNNMKRWDDLSWQQMQAQFANQQAAEARKQQAFNLYSQMLGQSASQVTGIGQVDFNTIQNLLNQARQQRVAGTDLNYKGAESDALLGQMSDMTKGNGNQSNALQDMGKTQINNSYLSALRDARSSGAPPSSQAGMQANLLRQKIRSMKDYQNQMAVSELSRRQSAQGQMAGFLEYLRSLRNTQEQSILGDTNLGANLNYQTQASNVSAQAQAAQIRQQQLDRLLQMSGM